MSEDMHEKRFQAAFMITPQPFLCQKSRTFVRCDRIILALSLIHKERRNHLSLVFVQLLREPQRPHRGRGRSSEGADRRRQGEAFRTVGSPCGDHPARFTPEAIKANQAVIDLLARIGEQKQATQAQIALAWLLAQSSWIVPIPGSRKIERLEENIGAVNVDLTEGDLREIDSAISNITVLGDRY